MVRKPVDGELDEPVINNHRVLRSVFLVQSEVGLALVRLPHDQRSEQAVGSLQSRMRMPEMSARVVGLKPTTIK